MCMQRKAAELTVADGCQKGALSTRLQVDGVDLLLMQRNLLRIHVMRVGGP